MAICAPKLNNWRRILRAALSWLRHHDLVGHHEHAPDACRCTQRRRRPRTGPSDEPTTAAAPAARAGGRGSGRVPPFISFPRRTTRLPEVHASVAPAPQGKSSVRIRWPGASREWPGRRPRAGKRLLGSPACAFPVRMHVRFSRPARQTHPRQDHRALVAVASRCGGHTGSRLEAGGGGGLYCI